MTAASRAGLPVILGVAAGLVIAGAGVAAAQSGRIDNGVVSLETFGFYWETRLDPASPPIEDLGTFAAATPPNRVHRVLLDRGRKIYFGYDVEVVTLDGAGNYRVTFQPLSVSRETATRLFGGNREGWTYLRVPSFPPTRTMRGGEVIEMALLTGTTSPQRLIDYVTVQEPSRRFNGFQPVTPREFSTALGAPRDFKASDVELRLQSPRVSINGRSEESSLRVTEEAAEAQGPVVWFYLPGRGRFALSLAPHPGFKRAGEVRGTSLRFVVGKDTFTATSASRIAPGQAAFNLYVRHDPAWRPTYLHADTSAFILDAVDQAEALTK